MATAKSRPASRVSPAPKTSPGARSAAAKAPATPAAAAKPSKATTLSSAPKAAKATKPAEGLPKAAKAAKPPRAQEPAGAPKAEGAKKPEGAASGLAAGEAAPAFSLASDSGAVSLRDFKGKKLVLYFYPKDDTPGCTREACAFQQELAALASRGASVVGVSRDSLASHARFKAKYGLNFTLLSDPDGAVHRAYGAWGVKKLYGRESIGPLRTTVVIDEAGRVARVFSNVRVDGHVDNVLEALGGR